MSERIYRDSVHNIIRLETDNPGRGGFLRESSILLNFSGCVEFANSDWPILHIKVRNTPDSRILLA